MYKFLAKENEALGRALKPFVLAVADYAAANWLNSSSRRRRCDIASDNFCKAIDEQVQLAYAAGTKDSMHSAPILMTKQEVINSIRDNSLLSDAGLRLLLNGDSITVNLELITQMANYAIIPTSRKKAADDHR